MKYLSLFSGIGGFELGIQQAYEDLQNRERKQMPIKSSRDGISSKRNIHGTKRRNSRILHGVCVGYSEIDKYAIQVYNKHFKHKNYGDITKINEKELPDFDLIVGGFPCQSFSIAGKRGGFNDTRGTLFFEIARIVREKQPRLLLLENVKGLLSHEQGATFRTIISTLDELGYDCQWQVLNSKNFGVPQNRERVFIIGHLRGTSRPEVFPIGGKNTISCNEIGTITAIKGAEHSRRCYGVDGLHPCLSTCMGGNTEKKILDKDMVVRRLTPKECERLQGFPDDWTKEGVNENGDVVAISDTQRYKMAGNAVTTCVVKQIMIRLLYNT